MNTRLNYRHTVFACYIGYITQAIVNNLAPLLFLTFQKTFAVSLTQITFLVTVNFLTQLLVDLLSAKYVDRIGYRPCMVAAHVLSVLGLVGLAFLPELLPTPYAGLLTAVILYAVGGGLLEVLVSPIVEACPSDNKRASMSLLHSFYCWGSVAVIALSTALFAWLGMESWKTVACLWALVPACNAVAFLRVPIAPIVAEGEGMTILELARTRLFWLLALLMVCAGASEQAMSQWASAFAESALHVTKAMGDLAGPCFFAVLMGLARMLYARLSDRVPLERYITACACLCVAGYAMAVLLPLPLLSLLGCGICGFAVGVMWPGTFSIATGRCPRGGTALFALLALAGDTGCSLGPTLVGLLSGAFGDNLKAGLAFGAIFPVVMILGIRRLDCFNHLQS